MASSARMLAAPPCRGGKATHGGGLEDDWVPANAILFNVLLHLKTTSLQFWWDSGRCKKQRNGTKYPPLPTPVEFSKLHTKPCYIHVAITTYHFARPSSSSVLISAGTSSPEVGVIGRVRPRKEATSEPRVQRTCAQNLQWTEHAWIRVELDQVHLACRTQFVDL